MAFSSTALSAAELAAKALDKPLFLGRNVLEDYNALPEWKGGGSGTWTSGSDITYGSAYTSYLFDGRGTVRSYPGLGSYTGFTIIFDLVAGTDDDHTFDTIAIWNHNLHLLTPTSPTVTFQVSDASDFTTNLTTLATWTVTTGDRLVAYLTSRYSSVRYARLVIASSAGAFTTTAPAIGEIHVARRRQMGAYPDLPWTAKKISRKVTSFADQAGDESVFVHYRGRRTFDNVVFRSGGLAGSIDSCSEMEDLWDSLDQGTKTMVFCPQPYSAPNDVLFCRPPDDFDLDVRSLGPTEREFAVSLNELRPFRLLDTE